MPEPAASDTLSRVNSAELLDAEIAIRDLLAGAPVGGRARAQREQGASRGFVVQIAALGQRRPAGREQPPVEGRDAKIASAATGVRQAGDGAKNVPQTSRVRTFRQKAERFDAVAVAVHRMPQRHQAPRFGKEQKQNPVDDRERLLEGVRWYRRLASPRRPHQCRQHVGGRRQYAILERPADAGAVAIGLVNERVESRRESTQHEREGREGALVIGDGIEIELCVSPGVRPRRIHEAKRGPVEKRTPPCRAVQGMRDAVAPQQLEGLAPRRDDERRWFAAGIDGRDEDRPVERDVARLGKAHDAGERSGAHAKHGPETRSWPEGLTAPPRVPKQPPGRAHLACGAVGRQLLFEKRLGEQMAGKSGKHQRDGSSTSRSRSIESAPAIDSRSAIRCAMASDTSARAA
jgi:hypothetical protein